MSREMGGSSPEEMGLGKESKESFELDAEILGEYPDLQSLPEEVKTTVSATYKNVRTAERYLEDVQSGKPTGDVEYHLKFVGETLDELKSANNHVLDKFIKDHEAKLADVTAKAQEAIGDKKRDMNGGGIYR